MSNISAKSRAEKHPMYGYEKTAEKVSNFGENVRVSRKQIGFTARELGAFVGITPTHVGMIERGERKPSLETFIRICDILGECANEMLMPQRSHRLVLDGPPITKPYNPY